MKYRVLLSIISIALLTSVTGCHKRTTDHDHDHEHHDHDHDHTHENVDSFPPDWRPEDASRALHINEIHEFRVGPQEEANLRVSNTEDGRVNAELNARSVAQFGGELKVLFVLDWEENPTVLTREAYLESLEAIEGLLVMSGENK